MQNLSVFLPMSFQGKQIAGVCFGFELAFFSSWCLPGRLNQCLAWSVSQCLLPIYLKGSLDVFQDQPNVFLPVSVWWVDQCLSEQVLNCVFLPMSYYENPAGVFPDWALRLLANVFLVSSVDVFHEVSPNVSCQICLEESLDVFLDQPNVCLLPMSV